MTTGDYSSQGAGKGELSCVPQEKDMADFKKNSTGEELKASWRNKKSSLNDWIINETAELQITERST